MASKLILTRFRLGIERFEQFITSIFMRQFPSADELCLVSIELPKRTDNNRGFSLKDIIGDGFLWGVPTHRRTIEKRLKRRFGDPYYFEKILRPKTTIKTCDTCGSDHLSGVLCPTCYKKVMDETKAMQETIVNELQLNPVDKEVVVMYEGEKNDRPEEFWQGKRIVEMNKPRPDWFSKNLLQETTQQPATTTDVKPSDLG